MILAFADTETPHLNPRGRVPWEIAIIRRRPDGTETEHVWQVRPDLATADPVSLRFGRYGERFIVPDDAEASGAHPDHPIIRMTREQVATAISNVLDGAVIVGSNAQFDANWIGELLNRHDIEPNWHYRPVCVATRAEGYLTAIDPEWVAEQSAKGPISSYALSRRLGVEPPAKDVAHTALGDARWHKALYDALPSRRAVSAR